MMDPRNRIVIPIIWGYILLWSIVQLWGIFWAGPAYPQTHPQADPQDGQSTIQIGGANINGMSTKGTPVTIAPSDEPGALAVVTMDNLSVNAERDNGVYPLALGGPAPLTVQVEFTYNAGPQQGADRIVVLPPGGVICEPRDCSMSVIEGFKGSILLFDWRGM